MMTGFISASAIFLPTIKVKQQRDFSAAEKTKRHGSVRAEGFQRAIGKPFGRLRRGEIPCVSGKAIYNRKDQLHGRAHLARHSTDVGKSSLGALLRKRKVTGRDASLPAPLLATSLGLVGRGTVGALPQTPAGTLSLHPARGNCPLTPFWRSGLSALPMLCPAGGFCPFLPFLIGTRT